MRETFANRVMPRPAATVVVVRPGPAGPEVFMVKRHSKASFASSYVFPGGVLEDDDASATLRCINITGEQAAERLGLEENALHYYSAAFREVLEETGVLLAEPARPVGVDVAAVRDALNSGSLRWSDFLSEHDLHLPCERLHYIAYWVTPRGEPKRYSTRFFVAEVPRGQAAMHDGAEVTDSRWMRPRDLLHAGKHKKMRLPYVTRSTLRDIADFEEVSGIIEWARSRESSGAARLLPAFVTVDGKDMVVLPDSPHYPEDFDW